MDHSESALQSRNHSETTLRYYDDNAVTFSSATMMADMGGNRRRFLRRLPENTRILDFGCGSGRDAKAFLEEGYTVEAIDGSAELCRIASDYTGIEVKQMQFRELDAESVYDGIWACASILHLERVELAEVLKRIGRALKPGGVLYTSFKYGSYEGMRNGRYFTDFTEETLAEFWKSASSLEIVETWITQDVRPGRESERWINLLARRV